MLFLLLIIPLFIILTFLPIHLNAKPLLFEPEKTIEIHCVWTGGCEGSARSELFKKFERKFPSVRIIHANITCSNNYLKDKLLIERILQGNPPDTFQVHAGNELINNFVLTGIVQPVTTLLKDMDIIKKINPQLLDICSYEGKIYGVPLTMHRGNLLFYNKKILQKYNIEPPKNIYEVITSMDKIEKKGIIPLAVGNLNDSSLLHIFENIMLETLGIYSYQSFCNGEILFDDPAIIETIKLFKKTTSYMNQNYNQINWQQAVDMVYKGEAAYLFMGDWALNYFKSLGAIPGEDIDWRFIGSSSYFILISDIYTLPKNCNNSKYAKEWLKLIANKKVQTNFCKIKGTTSPRLDIISNYNNTYLSEKDNDSNKHMYIYFPSMAFGGASSDNLVFILKKLLVNFVDKKN